jgi:hypothetical protein
MDVAMLAEETAVTTTAEHDIRVELTAKLMLSFDKNALEVWHTIEDVLFAWEFVHLDFVLTQNSVLYDVEVVTADRCDEKGGGFSRFASVSKIFNKVEEFTGLIAN